jgi:predicted nucleic acid-binding protein
MSRVDSQRLYLDTSVIAAAMGRDWPESPTCKELLRAVGAGRVLATTSAESLRELLAILQEHDEEQAALVAAPALEALLGPLAHVTATDALLASEMLGQCPGLSTRLAVHVAMAARLGCSALVTLSQVPPQGLPVLCVAPADPALSWERSSP